MEQEQQKEQNTNKVLIEFNKHNEVKTIGDLDKIVQTPSLFKDCTLIKTINRNIFFSFYLCRDIQSLLYSDGIIHSLYSNKFTSYGMEYYDVYSSLDKIIFSLYKDDIKLELIGETITQNEFNDYLFFMTQKIPNEDELKLLEGCWMYKWNIIYEYYNKYNKYSLSVGINEIKFKNFLERKINDLSGGSNLYEEIKQDYLYLCHTFNV